MMSLHEIARLSEEMATKAAAKHKQPYVFFDESEIKPPWKFPLLGDYEPEGWELEERLFCDKTGQGYSSELALTTQQLTAKLKEYHGRKRKTYGFGIVEEGPFQLYVGVFRKLDDHADVP